MQQVIIFFKKNKTKNEIRSALKWGHPVSTKQRISNIEMLTSCSAEDGQIFHVG